MNEWMDMFNQQEKVIFFFNAISERVLLCTPSPKKEIRKIFLFHLKIEQ